MHAPGVVDISTPRSDGEVTVAVRRKLALIRDRQLIPFARGAAGYTASPGDEPYIALSTGGTLRRIGCSFGTDVTYALKLGETPGIAAIDALGRAHSFVRLPSRGALTGITFDTTGHFGGRLLVTAIAGQATSVFAIDCHRHVSLLTRTAPRVEGGISVAPLTFGAFAGDLIAADENSGRIYATTPSGSTRLVVQSGLARGGDVGAESTGFVPFSLGPGRQALVADRQTPHNPHPGDDAILSLDVQALLSYGVRAGDLLVATEGGAETDAISCSTRCAARQVATGPPEAHIEGHIVFTGR